MQMSVYALGDLHLSEAAQKPMDVFGAHWEHHQQRIEIAWKETIEEGDLVLIPGDISWAMTLDEAAPDLAWISGLPGTKVMIRGNHDYWWNGIGKVRAELKSGLYAIQNDAMAAHGYAVCGTRGWLLPSHPKFSPEDEAIYRREAQRLRLSLEKARELSLPILAMLHYPPVGKLGEDTLFSNLLEEFGVSTCVYGHLHGPAHRFAVEGECRGVNYHLVSADFIQFQPLLIATGKNSLK